MKNSSPTPLQISRGVRRTLFSTIFGSSFAVCIGLQFLTGFALSLHASDIQVGLLTAIPMLGMASMTLTVLFSDRMRHRRPAWHFLAMSSRTLWLVISLLPLLALWVGPSYFGVTLWVFLGLMALGSVMGSLSLPLWFSWMSDLIPRDQMGGYWSRRMAISSIVNVLAIPMGWALDLFRGEGPYPYAFLFLIASILGQVEIQMYGKVVEPPVLVPSSAPLPLWNRMTEPFRNSDYRRLLVFFCSWNFAIFFADGFVVLYFLKEAGLNQLTLALAASCMWVMRWAVARYWGFLGDRYGNASVLRLCTAALVFWPLAIVFWGHSQPVVTLFAIYLYMGIFNVGVESSTLTLMVGLSPGARRSTFISVFHSCIGIVAFAAPLLGGAFLEVTHHQRWIHGTLDHYQLIFLIAAILRVMTVVFIPLQFQAAKGVAPVILMRRLMDANPFRVIHHSFVLDEGTNEDQRVDAVHELGQSRSSMASEQLVRALRDPSLDVRRGAVHALVRIGDRTCVPALLEVARVPESRIQGEALEALGKLGDLSVTPFLVSMLENPLLRMSALRGLSDLKDPASLPAIRPWCEKPSLSEETRGGAFEAWCALADTDAILPCLKFIRGCRHDFPRWQAVVALSEVTVAPVNFYSVLQRELRVRGEAVTQTTWVEHSTVAREKSASLRQTASALCLHAEGNYMEGRWDDALRGFVLTPLICLEMIPPTAHDALRLVEAEQAFRETLSAFDVTRSRLILSLRLAEALLETAGKEDRPATQEEALLAHCLLRKLLGTS